MILSRYEELKSTHDELQRKVSEEVEKRSRIEVEKQMKNFRLQGQFVCMKWILLKRNL